MSDGERLKRQSSFLHSCYPSRYHIKFNKICLLGLSLPFGISSAQTPALSRQLVHGAVRTAQGSPAPDVSVEIRDLRGLRVGRTVTDRTGVFEIESQAKPGTYILLAAREPQAIAKRVTISEAAPYFTLTLSSSTASKAPGPQDATVSVNNLQTSDKVRKYIRNAQKEFNQMSTAAALQDLDLALKIENNCAAALTMRAFVKLAIRDLRGAVADAHQAMNSDPQDLEAYIAAATASNSLGHYDDAAEAAAQGWFWTLTPGRQGWNWLRVFMAKINLCSLCMNWIS